MINLIVFSRNRPMQLQAWLDSVELHARGFFNNVDVLYRADELYQPGYEMLKKRKPYVNFHEEQDFQSDLVGLFKMDYTMMSADDDLFYRDINKGLFRAFTPDTAAFSLRLGKNINYCYPLDTPMTLPVHADEGEFMRWKWRGEDGDFGYPLSVVSHIFRTEQICELSSAVEYTSPNVYEGVLQRQLQKLQPEMVSYQESRVFGVPANKVQTDNQNRNGVAHPYSPEELNLRYLIGQKIDVTQSPIIHQAQQEITYVFV